MRVATNTGRRTSIHCAFTTYRAVRVKCSTFGYPFEGKIEIRTSDFTRYVIDKIRVGTI